MDRVVERGDEPAERLRRWGEGAAAVSARRIGFA
jgi:hypothetical protein